jgi:hypothetical protein
MGGLDVLGYLPAPAAPANRGAADVLDGQLFAYGASSSVAVLEASWAQGPCGAAPGGLAAALQAPGAGPCSGLARAGGRGAGAVRRRRAACHA